MTDPATASAPDKETADAFADSWLNLPAGSVYTPDQFEEWMAPVTKADFAGARVLEMGCGNGSLLVHAASWQPAFLQGIDLGESIRAAGENLEATGFDRWRIEQADLVAWRSEPGFDVVYCIGVLHHLKNPGEGFRAVVANTAPGGRFHCWVYGREGNLPVRLIVEPMRKVFSKFPWWFTKYFVATPLSVPVFVYAKSIAALGNALPFVRKLPLSEYFFWIAKREWWFFRHVIFDQLVTPTTHYISRPEIEQWLASVPGIAPDSTYVLFRNGNSWKFGGRIRTPART